MVLTPNCGEILVFARPIIGEYSEVAYISRICQKVRTELDLIAFQQKAVVSHGVVGSIRGGFWEIIAFLSEDPLENDANRVLDLINVAILKQARIWQPIGDDLQSPRSRIDQIFYSNRTVRRPDPTLLASTFNGKYSQVGKNWRHNVARNPVTWPFEFRRSQELSDDIILSKLKRTFFVGACLKSSNKSLDSRQNAAAELVARFWGDELANPALSMLRQTGLVYSYVAGYSQESGSLCFGVYVKPEDVRVAYHRVSEVVSRPLNSVDLIRAKNEMLSTFHNDGVLVRMIRNAVRHIEFGATCGFEQSLEAVTISDCREVLEWKSHNLVTEMESYV